MPAMEHFVLSRCFQNSNPIGLLFTFRPSVRSKGKLKETDQKAADMQIIAIFKGGIQTPLVLEK